MTDYRRILTILCLSLMLFSSHNEKSASCLRRPACVWSSGGSVWEPQWGKGILKRIERKYLKIRNAKIWTLMILQYPWLYRDHPRDSVSPFISVNFITWRCHTLPCWDWLRSKFLMRTLSRQTLALLFATPDLPAPWLSYQYNLSHLVSDKHNSLPCDQLKFCLKTVALVNATKIQIDLVCL